MSTARQPSRLLFAAALIALGVTGIVNDEFALVWQNVPAYVPGRAALAYLCAVAEVLTGLALLWRSTLRPARRFLLPYMLLWLLLLEVPPAFHAPLDAGSWGTIGEIAIITAGVFCLFAHQAAPRTGSRLLTSRSAILAGRWILVFALPMIGMEVLLQGSTYKLPPWLAWLPHSVDWVYLSGLGSVAAGLAILFGIWPRLAAHAEAAMLAVVTVWFWGPYLHTGHTATTAFIISALIAIGVWLVGDTYSDLDWLRMAGPLWSQAGKATKA